RNMTDDQIKALAANGGGGGIYFVPQYLAEQPQKATVDTLIKHIRYVADLVGVDHVGIGADYDGGIETPVIPEVSQLGIVTQAMMNDGFTNEEMKKVWGGNF